MPYSIPNQNDNNILSKAVVSQGVEATLGPYGPSSPKKQTSSLTIGDGTLTGTGTSAVNEEGFLDVRGNVGTTVSGLKEKLVSTFNGIAGTYSTTPAVAEITSIGITGTQAGSDATTVAGATENTDVSFGGTGGPEATSLSFVKTLDENSQIFSHAAYGDGTWIVISTTDKMYRSTDNGATWVLLTLPRNNPTGIAFGNGNWVLSTGDDAKPYYSTDGGNNWTQSTASFTNNNVAFGDGVFIATEVGTNIIGSFDGSAWGRINTGIQGVMQKPLYANGVWICTTGTYVVRRSTDGGASWSTITLADDGANCTDIAYANGTWCVTTDDGKTWVSTDDGVSWTEGSTVINSVSLAGNDDFFVSRNNTGQTQTSTDGLSWTSLSTGLTGESDSGSIAILNGIGLFLGNDVWTATPTSAGDSVSVTFDTGHSTNPITYTSTVGATGATQDSEFRTAMQAAIGANILTGVTVSAVTDATRIVSTATGVRTDLTVAIAGNPGSSATSTINVSQQGVDDVMANRTSYTVTAGSPHSPSTVSSTFNNDLSAADCLTQIRDHFVNDQIGGYGVDSISGTDFRVTSDTPGTETDLTFVLNAAGTGGDLVAGDDVVTQGADGFTTGTATTWTVDAEGISYSGEFSSGANLGESVDDIVNGITPSRFVISSLSNVLTIEAEDAGNATDYTIVISTTGTSQTATQPSLVNTDGIAELDTLDSLQLSFTGGSLITLTGLSSSDDASAIADRIVAQGYSGIELVRDDTFDVDNNALTSGDARVKFTYDNPSTQTDVTASNFPVIGGNTSGTLSIPSVVIVTQGVDLTGNPLIVRMTGGGLTGNVDYNSSTTIDKATFVTGLIALINANDGTFTYTESNDVNLASNAKQRYPDLTITRLSGIGTITLAAATVVEGHS